MTEESTEIRVVRDSPTPLRMTKRRTGKEDGRYLIYYTFEDGAERTVKCG